MSWKFGKAFNGYNSRFVMIKIKGELMKESTISKNMNIKIKDYWKTFFISGIYRWLKDQRKGNDNKSWRHQKKMKTRERN